MIPDIDLIRLPASDPWWVIALLIGSRSLSGVIILAWIVDMIRTAPTLSDRRSRLPWHLSWHWTLTAWMWSVSLLIAVGVARVLLAGHIREQTPVGHAVRGAEILGSLHGRCWTVLAWRRRRHPDAAVDRGRLYEALAGAKPLVVADIRGTILDATDPLVALWGGERDALVGQNLMVLMPTRYREAHRRGMRRYAETGEGEIVGTSVPLDLLRADGTEIPIFLAVTAASFGGGECFIGAVYRRNPGESAPVPLTVASS